MSEAPDEASAAPERARESEPRDAVHDDDELASALAAQLLRFAPSGPIPIIRPSDAPPSPPRVAAPAAVDLAPTGPRFSPPEAPPTPPQAVAAVPVVPPTVPPVAPPVVAPPVVPPVSPPTPAPEPEQVSAPSAPSETDPISARSEQAASSMSRPSVPGASPAAPAGSAAEDQLPQPTPPPAASVDSTDEAVEDGPGALDPDLFLDEGSALDRAERLQEVLSKIDLDDAAYEEWETSLRSLGGGAPRRVEEPVVTAPTSTEESSGPSTDVEVVPAASPAPDDAAEVETRNDGDAFGLPGVPLDGSGATPEAPPVTSTIDLPPTVPSAVPDDELVAIALPAETTGDIVEAEILDHDEDEVDGDLAPADDPADGDVAAGIETVADSEPARFDDVDVEDAEIVVDEVPTEDSSDQDDPLEDGAEDGAEDGGGVGDPSPNDVDLDEADGIDDRLDVSIPVAMAVPYPAEVAVTTGSIPISFDPSVVASEESRADTGSIPVLGGPLNLDVDVDATDGVDDVAAPFEAVPGSASDPLPVAPPEPGQDTGPIVPISTASLIGVPPVLPLPEDLDAADDGPASREIEAEATVERVGIEPTSIDRRLGELARMFWLWIAPNTSILTFSLGAIIVGAGLSARQSIVAAVLGIALACIPLGMSTLAVKRSGQPTAIVSRASFGVVGNIVPTVLLLLVRLFWIAVLLWLLAVTTASLTFESGYDLFVAPRIAGIVALTVFGIGAGAVAVIGFRVLAAMQAILAVLGVVVAGLVIVLTAPLLDFGTITDTTDGDWLGVLAGAITVFSLLGTGWAAAGGDLARYQRPGTSGAATVALTGLGAALPTLALISWGVLLASSDEALSVGLQTDPIAAISGALPGWYPVPLLLAIVISVLSGVAAIGYSGGLTLLAAGVRTERSVATGAVVLVGIAGAFAMLFLLPSLSPVLLDLAPTLAVPVAAWGGIVAGEMFIRRRAFDSSSLLRRGGVYPDVRWVNLISLVVITVAGLGLIAGTQGWFLFEGYLWRAFGVDTSAGIGSTDLGVLIALVLGLLVPVVSAIPTIRAEESGRPAGPTASDGHIARTGAPAAS